MALDYSKWDRMDEFEDLSDSGSGSDEDDGGRSSRGFGLTSRAQLDGANPYGPCTAITVAWDLHSERLRWALDRHYRRYLDRALPWGFHVLWTVGYSRPIPAAQTVVAPVLEAPAGPGSEPGKDAPAEVYRTVTEQNLYLMSKSLGSQLRMYPHRDTLGLEQQIEQDLAGPAASVFYFLVLGSGALTDKYLFQTIRIDRIRTLYRLAWPFLKWYIRFHFKASEKSAREAFDKAAEVFKKIDEMLKTQPGSIYLHCDQFSAADIAFACFAAPFLLASQEDVGAHLAVGIPSMQEAPEWMAAKAKELRASPAGKHAIRMYRKERGSKDTVRIKESRYDKAGRPWWSQNDLLIYLVWGSFVAFLVIFLVLWDWVSRIIALLFFTLALAVLGYFLFPILLQNREVIGRLWFAQFGTPVEQKKKSLAEVREGKAKAEQASGSAPKVASEKKGD